jgi:hypothetical protein
MKSNRKVARVRVKKFYKKMFMHFFDIALINAFVLSKHIPNRKIESHGVFRLKLIEQILLHAKISQLQDIQAA